MPDKLLCGLGLLFGLDLIHLGHDLLKVLRHLPSLLVTFLNILFPGFVGDLIDNLGDSRIDRLGGGMLFVHDLIHESGQVLP